MKGKVAWVDFNSIFPTPIHQATISLKNGTNRKIYLKREDLSNLLYGGNKVRTLEHLIGCAASEYRRIQPDKSKKGKLLALGGPGSNQAVAVSTYTRFVADDLEPGCLYLMPEASNVENCMNLLSTVSASYLQMKLVYPVWTSIYESLMTLVTVILSRKSDTFICSPGGANPSGALGHVGAAFELAAQVREGLLPSPVHIILPHGSGCTVSGLLVGILIAKKRGLGFERMKSLRSIPIHPGMAAMNNMLARKAVTKLVTHLCDQLFQLGQIDVRSEAQEALTTLWKPMSGYAGDYGAASPKSREASIYFQKNTNITTSDGQTIAPSIWLDETFSGKAMTHLLESVESNDIPADEPIVFWTTKSPVQCMHSPLSTPFEKIDEHRLKHSMRGYLERSSIKTESDIKHHPAIVTFDQ